MKLQPEDKKQLLKAALGGIPSDLLTRHVQLVDMIIGEIYLASVFVYDGMIAHAEYKNLDAGLDKATTVVDGQGHYLIPGFLDARKHTESSMITPRNFAKVVLPHGTTTVITDPHEIINIWDMESVRYIRDNGEDLPMRQLIDTPSYVLAVPGLENAGADFLAEQIEELYDLKCVIGLAEVMGFLAVIYGEDRMVDILEVAEDHELYMQGHIPYVSGRMLSAYLCGGPNTCHETRASSEGLEKLRSVMYVDARGGSITENVEDIWEGVKQVEFFDHLCFCTDDREAGDILSNKHMNDVARSAIRCGIDPVAIIKSATYNTAREIRIEDLEAIVSGFVVDMLLVESLEELKPSHVFYNGELVAENGKLLADTKDESHAIEHRNSMHVKGLSVENFRIQAPVENGTARVNLMEYKDLLSSSTLVSCEELPMRDGYLKLSDDDLKFTVVVNRHEGHDTVALSVVRGFGIAAGTLAPTVSHDSHNLAIIYDTTENALLATDELIACGNGMCAVKSGVAPHTLQLPLAGPISLRPAKELAVDNALMKDTSRVLGLMGMRNPLLRIVALALPVIPGTKISDLGLIDVLEKETIPLLV